MIKDKQVRKALEIIEHEFSELEDMNQQNERDLERALERLEILEDENEELKKYVAELEDKVAELHLTGEQK